MNIQVSKRFRYHFPFAICTITALTLISCKLATPCFASAGSLDIAVAGDMRGHLIGTVSQNDGTLPIQNTEVLVTGTAWQGAWQQTAQTDNNGFFSVDQPFSAKGAITMVVNAEGKTSKLIVDSGDLSQSLTPRPSDPKDRISLEGKWQIALDPPASLSEQSKLSWKPTRVPSHWEMEGFVAETGRAAYKKTFAVPAAWKGKRIKFRSEGIYSKAEVWVNGKRIGSHLGGATPFELDITDAAKPGAANIISVLVTDQSDASDLDAMSYYAHLNLGGIWRPLEVFAVEPQHVARIAITTDFMGPEYSSREVSEEENFDVYKNAMLSVDLTLANEQQVQKIVKLKLTLLDPKGTKVSTILTLLDPEGRQVRHPVASLGIGPWSTKLINIQTPVSNPKHWTAETPNLYTLIIEMQPTEGKASTVTQRFGFREVEIKGRTYMINGKRVKFWGACRHDADPLLGRAITPEIARQDIVLMKGCNMNSMRTSHYPPHPAALEAADELGYYVEDEAPFCFISVPYGPAKGRTRDLSMDLRYAPMAMSITSQFIERDRNHPSVVIWSQCNEGSFGTVMKMCLQRLRELDRTRPTSGGQSSDSVDIYTLHNPTTKDRMVYTAPMKQPVLFDEMMAIFQGPGSQAQGLDLDPGIRDYWVTGFTDVFNTMLRSEHQFGGEIWAWVDDAFLTPGKGIEYGRFNLAKAYYADDLYKMPRRGIVGDPMWGVVDGWRRPRPEWWLCKKLFSPIAVAEEPIEPSKELAISVENRNCFINLNEYACKWTLGNQAGVVKAGVPPLSMGRIKISLKQAPKASDKLKLEFYDKKGNLIDGYKLAFQPKQIAQLPNSGKAARIKDELGNLDFGLLVRLLGKNCELTFDRTCGLLVRGITGNEPVILAGPTLHVMNMKAPIETFPTNWAFTDTAFRTEGAQASVDWNGKYGDQFTGGFKVGMDDAGDITVDYKFTYNGVEMTTREVGLQFEVPLTCDTLQWDRKAEWSYYPDDEIGRPQGKTRAHTKMAQTVPPGNRPFSKDDHVWGCNDFRSVKRNFYTASLTDKQGAGIKFYSDGTQSIRATVAPRSILVKVMDFYGGTASNEWWVDDVFGKGHIIKPGDVLSGTVKMKMLAGKQ